MLPFFFFAIHQLSRRNLWALRLCEVIDHHTIWKTLLKRASCMPTVTDRIVQWKLNWIRNTDYRHFSSFTQSLLRILSSAAATVTGKQLKISNTWSDSVLFTRAIPPPSRMCTMLQQCNILNVILLAKTVCVWNCTWTCPPSLPGDFCQRLFWNSCISDKLFLQGGGKGRSRLEFDSPVFKIRRVRQSFCSVGHPKLKCFLC